MKKVMIALSMAGGLFVVAAGCSKEEAKGDGKTAQGSAESTGVAECDDYIKKMEACLSKVPAAAKAGMEQNYKATRDGFKTAAATVEGKTQLKMTCKALVDGIATNPACK